LACLNPVTKKKLIFFCNHVPKWYTAPDHVLILNNQYLLKSSTFNVPKDKSNTIQA